ncbi:MAG: FkbM family methyltransferase [Verrucomicrobia bacterium]|jgi:FkbM family methyltransferase|nr:FkbM family methyltransferase [Verrucomicrobiota bacterium]
MRIQRFFSLMRFAATAGNAPRQKLALFYHTALKPSLAFRGWAKHSPKRILSFAIKVPGGRTFKVCARDNGLEANTIAEYFGHQFAILPPSLPPYLPKVIYDLGANIGIASLYFSTFYPQSTFYGFEPLPANFEVCTLNYRNLRNSQAFPWAAGDHSGTAVFDCLDDPRGGRLQSSLHDPRLKKTGRIEVKIVSIDDLIKKKGLPPPDFLKVDVEGAEMDVLKGLKEHYRGLKRLFVETHSPELKRDCLKWMQERGFKIRECADETALWGDRFEATPVLSQSDGGLVGQVTSVKT